MHARLMKIARGALVLTSALTSVLAGCAPTSPPADKPFDVMTALQDANRAPPAPEQILPRTCRRITEKECW